MSGTVLYGTQSSFALQLARTTRQTKSENVVREGKRKVIGHQNIQLAGELLQHWIRSDSVAALEWLLEAFSWRARD
jgi:hypothetical protein